MLFAAAACTIAAVTIKGLQMLYRRFVAPHPTEVDAGQLRGDSPSSTTEMQISDRESAERAFNAASSQWSMQRALTDLAEL